ncbi:Phytosulfokine receptor 2 [Platanthera zijinensis]|uniref:non-specific serine/threonine protein kinase n=1 Tax=Platanthera zijinensis TaxID=2320716 RepID=A0AAP0BY97_9ASPA
MLWHFHGFPSLTFVKLAILAGLTISSSSSCYSGDLEALRGFAETLTNGSILLSWPDDKACCFWDGVFCSPDTSNSSRVTLLHLADRGLRGSISALLSNLNELQYLDLSGNALSGGIPPELSSLRRLQHLDLSHNALSGPVTTIAAINSIQSLNLSSNCFNGSLSDLGAKLSNLIHLNISNNYFYGSLGPGICIGSSLLQEVSPARSSIWFRCKSFLSLPFNDFTGYLSEKLSNLLELRRLIISGNGFSGELPKVLGNLTMLEQLVADSNSLSGELPRSLGDCLNLKDLNLRNNSFSGRIGVDFSSMTLLSTLDVASNYLEGDLPPSLSACNQLTILSFAKNKLSGEIPVQFAKLESLSFVSLSNNSFKNISGALAVFQSCRKLSTLILTKNFHGERIPESSYDFRNLSILALGNCNLFGKIPFWLINCSKLQVLDLSWNNLSGTIPPWIGQFDRLIYLDISNNSLTGEIPKNLTDLKNLRLVRASTYGNSMSEPLYVKHNRSISGLQYNQISGFPPALYLNDNGFNGTIRPEFGDLKALHVLDLSSNYITGGIPETISNMVDLEVLDLSHNFLNGTIPSSLNKLTFLSKFSVAHNHLHGEVPTGGQFFSFSNSSFEGNPGLCRELNPCNGSLANSGRTREIPSGVGGRIGKNSMFGIIISVAVGIGVLLGIILVRISKKEGRDQVDEEEEVEAEAMEKRSFEYSGSKLVLFFQRTDGKNLTANDILRATNDFDQANIIGCGGFGLVYKACLPDGTKVAVKKLTGDCGQMEREFRAEVEALSRARHENLVSLKGHCRNGDDRLLIYSFMENGSLDYWLHEKMDGGSLL